MLRRIIYFHVYIILDFHIRYKHDSVICQLECACLHKPANMVLFFVKGNENAYPKWRALKKMYRVVTQKKRGNIKCHATHCALFSSNENISCIMLNTDILLLYLQV